MTKIRCRIRACQKIKDRVSLSSILYFSLLSYVGLNSFLSTPKFIQCLTELSQTLSMMKDASKAEKRQYLQEEMILLNQELPASVYIPFVQHSTRNYCVLHIPPSEVHVFQTKERAPVLLCIEVFRPDEMAISIQQKFNKKMIKNLNKQSVNQDLMREKMPDNPYFQKQGSKDGDQISD